MSEAGVSTSDAPAVLTLGTDDAPGPEVIGRKAASVDWLLRNGFPTPSAACISTTAHRAYLSENGLERRSLELMQALPDEDARRELQDLYRTPVTPALHEALSKGVAAIAQSHLTPMLAVRSSATDEDSAAASFAGQHDTHLGVQPDEVEPRVRDCWASLWSAEAVAYRTKRNLSFEQANMAVLLQPLVAADLSAVAFTCNPVTANIDEVMVCIVSGLGEPLVAGQVTPATAVLDRHSLQVKDMSPGHNELVLVHGEGRLRYLDDAERDLVVDEEIVRSVARLALSAETLFGHPLDIEASWAGGDWHVLQARPITAMNGKAAI